jgi:ankyrin repeat protein
MKNYLALLFVILNLSNASSATTTLANDYNNIIVEGIIKNDYKVVSDLLSKRLINSRTVVDGKPLLIHAVINDKPDMVNLLIRYGAQPYADFCNEGYNAHEWAVKSQSYYARAELIVVSILNN